LDPSNLRERKDGGKVVRWKQVGYVSPMVEGVVEMEVDVDDPKEH